MIITIRTLCITIIKSRVKSYGVRIPTFNLCMESVSKTWTAHLKNDARIRQLCFATNTDYSLPFLLLYLYIVMCCVFSSVHKTYICRYFSHNQKCTKFIIDNNKKFCTSNFFVGRLTFQRKRKLGFF